MPTFKNPANVKVAAAPDMAGVVVCNPQVFDTANAAYRPASLGVGDLIEIGVVPAGCVLVPHLSRITIGAIAVTAGAVEVGTAAVPAALAAAAAATSARDLVGSGLSVPAATIGSRTAPTPIYARVTTAFTGVAASAKVRSELAVRAWEASVDG